MGSYYKGITIGLVALAFLGAWAFLSWPKEQEYPEHELKLGAGPAATIRQEVNITTSYLYAVSGSGATSSAEILIDPSKYSGTVTYYFEVVGSTTASTNSRAILSNGTSTAYITSATMNGTGAARYRSSAFVPPQTPTEYIVSVDNAAVGKGITSARVVIIQSFAGDANSDATSTQTMIEVGNEESYTSSATSTFASPKYWTYDSTKWDGTTTFYAEVTYANTTPLATTTSIFNTAGTYNIVASSTNTDVAAWGGGGASFDGTTAGGGKGGGGGAFASSTLSLSPGGAYTITVGAGGAASAARGATTTFGSNLVVASPGDGGSSATTLGGAGGRFANSVGTIRRSGGLGGSGDGTDDAGGGGGGAGGPHATGTAGTNASVSAGGGGGRGDGTFGGAGGNGGNAGACTAGTADLEDGGGGGGGADNGLNGCNGGSPGGGGGGGEGLFGSGAAGAVRLEFRQIASTTIALQEDDGSYGTWTDKVYIVHAGQVVSTSTRTRSAAFTPTTGRHYRIAFREGYNGATHTIYNAKIVVDQLYVSNSVSDSYDDDGALNRTFTATTQNYGQAFTGNGGIINTVQVYFVNPTSPIGTLVAEIYNVDTGTYGTNAAPNSGAVPIATSDSLNASTIGAGTTLQTFSFTGSNRIQLLKDSKYVLNIAPTAWTSGDVSVQYDNTSPSHAGNKVSSTDGGATWATATTEDLEFFVNVFTSTSTIESYSETNFSNNQSIYSTNFNAFGQTFTTSQPYLLETAKFYLSKSGSPTGNATAKLYAVTGLVGSTAVPTGAALATSDTFDVSTLTTSPTLTTLTFSSKYFMTAGNYALVFDYSGGDASNYVQFGVDLTSSTHSGNGIYYYVGAWNADSAQDSIFYALTPASITKLEPQYLLAPTKLYSGTAFQSFFDYFDPAEWSNAGVTYVAQAEAADNSTSVVTIQDSAGVTTYATVTSPDNIGTSALSCIPSSATIWDVKATTNNNDVYATRVLAQVSIGGSGTSQCAAGNIPRARQSIIWDE